MIHPARTASPAHGSAAPPPTRLGVEEALALVLGAAAPLPVEEVAVADAAGRVLAEPVHAGVTLPPWDNAAMDGYAVRAADVRGATGSRPVALRVRGEAPAGRPWAGTVGPGEAVRIATGAPIPAGADAVVRVEDTDAGQAVVQVRDDRDASTSAAGRGNVRPRGEDVAEGALVAPAGTRVGPALVGVLAAIGCARVRVRRRPRVAILASGDELVRADLPGARELVRSGRAIVSTNSLTLAALVREAGGEPVDHGIVPDDLDALAALMGQALDAGCDVLLTTGAVSVGERDHARAAFAAIAGALRFWRVRIRPGGPLAFGTVEAGGRSVPWLGLPGNPVSTMVTFALFAAPLLRTLEGDARPRRATLAATLATPVGTPGALAHYLRATLAPTPDGSLVAHLTGPQGSGLLTSMARADALVVVPEAVDALPAGARVAVLPLGALAASGEPVPLPAR